MKNENSFIHLGIYFSHEDKAGTGFLLSIDEVELIKNMALSLNSQDDIEFLNQIVHKEFVTKEEKEVMSQIFLKAASKIKGDPTLSA